MPIGAFIFDKSKRRTRVGNYVVVDVTTSLVTTRDAVISDNPVERGSDITDNVRLSPLSIQISGFISNAPTDEMKSVITSLAGGVLAGIGAAAGKALKVRGGVGAGSTVGALSGAGVASGLGMITSAREDNSDYPQKAMLDLLRAQEEQIPFTIHTFMFPTSTRNIYENMIIEKLAFPQDASSGDGLRFNLTARQITIVDLQISGVSSSFIKGLQAGNSAPKTKDLGRQTTKDPPTQTADQALEVVNGSWAKSLTDGIGSLFGGG